MNYKYSLLLMALMSMTVYAQDNDLAANEPIQIVLSSNNSVKKYIDFNPNGIRLTPSENADFLLLEFKEKVNDLNIEIIDLKGKLISQFRGNEVTSINFDTKSLFRGKYFIRVKSDTVKDFLKFEIK